MPTLLFLEKPKNLLKAFTVKNIIFFIVLLVNRFIYADQEWDRIRFHGLPYDTAYDINMGTGFYVNENTIVTNGHVVSNCINIAIRGAVQPQNAELYLIDSELDLAIVKSTRSIVKAPFIRSNYNVIKEGDMLLSVGYPLAHGQSGKYLINEAKVINIISDVKSTFSKIEFTNTVDHGNSGGPLLDKNSNLVGVVTAKHRYYDPKDPNITTKVAAVAIGIDGLIGFLKRHNIAFATLPSYDILTNYGVDHLVKNYIVNIHCVRLPLQ